MNFEMMCRGMKGMLLAFLICLGFTQAKADGELTIRLQGERPNGTTFDLDGPPYLIQSNGGNIVAIDVANDGSWSVLGWTRLGSYYDYATYNVPNVYFGNTACVAVDRFGQYWFSSIFSVRQTTPYEYVALAEYVNIPYNILNVFDGQGVSYPSAKACIAPAGTDPASIPTSSFPIYSRVSGLLLVPCFSSNFIQSGQYWLFISTDGVTWSDEQIYSLDNGYLDVQGTFNFPVY